MEKACFVPFVSTQDARGGFEKPFDCHYLSGVHIEFKCDEAFVSTSNKNVLRGLHFQLSAPQKKLVFCSLGGGIAILVDLRANSEELGKPYLYGVSEERKELLYIPRGFGFGFLSLNDNTRVVNFCDGKYDRDSDTGVRIDDSVFGIKLPIPFQETIRSEKDRNLMEFSEYLRNPMKG